MYRGKAEETRREAIPLDFRALIRLWPYNFFDCGHVVVINTRWASRGPLVCYVLLDWSRWLIQAVTVLICIGR